MRYDPYVVDSRSKALSRCIFVEVDRYYGFEVNNSRRNLPKNSSVYTTFGEEVKRTSCLTKVGYSIHKSAIADRDSESRVDTTVGTVLGGSISMFISVILQSYK